MNVVFMLHQIRAHVSTRVSGNAAPSRFTVVSCDVE